MDDPGIAVADMAQLVEGLMAVVGPGLVDGVPDVRRPLGVQQRAETGQDLLHVEMRVPHRHHREHGQLPHGLAVGPDGPPHDPRPHLLGDAVLAAGDLEAGGQSLDVPLPRAGRGLVEVVDIEEEVTLRRTEDPEIRHVGIAAELHIEPGGRCRGQILGHRKRRPPVVRERGDRHAAVADGYQLLDTGLRLAFEQCRWDRIGRAAGSNRHAGPSGTSTRAFLPFLTRSWAENRRISFFDRGACCRMIVAVTLIASPPECAHPSGPASRSCSLSTLGRCHLP